MSGSPTQSLALVLTQRTGAMKPKFQGCNPNLCACVLSRSVMSDSVTPWTVALQAPLSMEFSWQEYWIRLPFPPPGDLPNPEIEPVSLVSPALAGGFFTSVPPGKPNTCV